MNAIKLPSHEATYRQLRDMVLFGALAPGQPVTIQGLTSELGAGMTPVREAIRRLTAEGALEFLGNRRVCVPRLSPSQVDELAFAKLAIEPHLGALALAALSDADIDAIAAIDAALDRAIAGGDVQGYLRHNYRFHFALYDHAGAAILTAIARSLWLRFGPSMRAVCAGAGTGSLPDRHRDAVAAMRARDRVGLEAALADDIGQGITLVRQAMAVGEI